MNNKLNSKPIFLWSIVNCKLSIIYCFLSVVFCLFTFSAAAQEKEPGEIHKTKSSATIGGVKYYLHTVEKGQTLFAIAKFYGCTVNNIVIENPEAIDGISPGQVLRIPIEKTKQTKLVIDTTHFTLIKIEHSQTLFSISKKYNITIEKLKEINPELREGLKEGQIIKIPNTDKPLKSEKNTAEKIEKKPVDIIIINKPIEVAKKDTVIKANFTGELKEEYNIAFFLPFNADIANEIDLDKLIKGDAQFPNKTSVALQFYEGVLLAIDSLKKLKLNAKIFVYDLDDTDSLCIYTILKKPELAAMNLMIGPLYGSSFMAISKFAKENSIPIVSPFTQVNKILFNNPFVCKVTPSSTLQIEQMAHFVIDSFQIQNIILVNNGGGKEISLINAFKTTSNDDLLKAGHPIADSVKEAKNLSAVQSMLSLTKTNVIVLPSNNQSYVTEFIRGLNNSSDKYKIVLFGMHSWVNYDNLDLDYLNSLSLHIPSNNFIDYSAISTQSFIKEYREKYKTEPENYVYQAFDITYYFVSALQKFGTGFLKNIPAYEHNGYNSCFKFTQFPPESGFENKFVYILKYENFNLIKAN